MEHQCITKKHIYKHTSIIPFIVVRNTATATNLLSMNIVIAKLALEFKVTRKKLI